MDGTGLQLLFHFLPIPFYWNHVVSIHHRVTDLKPLIFPKLGTKLALVPAAGLSTLLFNG